MASFLVVFGTGTGQTASVAESIGTVIADRGHDVTTRRVETVSETAVGDFDAVLVGSPVIDRAHLPAVIAFVERNREVLTARPTAFFQLSFAAAIPFRWAREGAAEWVDALVDRTGWQPDRIGSFAGAIKYTQYDPATRLFFKLFAALTTGDTDTSRDYEYTNWDDVEAFAADFARFVERKDVGGGSQSTDTGLTRVVTGLGLLLGVSSLVYWLVVRRRQTDDGRRGSSARVGRADEEPSERIDRR
ncbi:flavodoxin domain-containing protein [Natrinema gelatinilyticum]|uniref:flavodoxin domain-containing protein n=1 Tax=Natrinema gelatinilyticum TaxID=2961571 RepID=UPI0020C5721D|nr:flavodoxin domain-containing protein [Natrinema gelatinilyticum]